MEDRPGVPGSVGFWANPFGALGLGRLAKGAGPGSMVPTMPPFSCRGGRSSLVGKQRTKLTVTL